MTYIPTMFVSIQQKGCAAGANVITAVNKNYTELVHEGYNSGSITGTVLATHLGVALTTNTNIQGVGVGQLNVTVREYLPQFLRQPVFYSTIVLPASTVSTSAGHGLTLGPKAFLNFLGYTGTRSNSPSGGLSLTEAQSQPLLGLSGANVVISCTQAPYVDGDGIITAYYCIVDPT